MNKQEYRKAYKEAHRAYFNAKQKEYYRAHREECLARGREYRMGRKEETKLYNKAYREAHMEKQFQKYCCDLIELIENYELAKADNFKGWCIHHRLELIKTGAVCNATKQDLIDWGIYYNRPADELVFMRIKDHMKLHKVGITYSKETRAKMSQSARRNTTGTHWFNNGAVNKRCYECPEGFKPGKIYRTRGGR